VRPCIPWYVSPFLQMLAGPHDSVHSQLDLRKVFGHVIPGLSDDLDEIKVISHMIIFFWLSLRLLQLWLSDWMRGLLNSRRLRGAQPPLKTRLNKISKELQRTFLPGRHHRKRSSPHRNSTWRYRGMRWREYWQKLATQSCPLTQTADIVFVFVALGDDMRKVSGGGRKDC